MRHTCFIFGYLLLCCLCATDGYSQQRKKVRVTSSDISYKFVGYNSQSNLYGYRIEAKVYQSCPADTIPAFIKINVKQIGGPYTYRLNMTPLSLRRSILSDEYDPCSIGPRGACYEYGLYYALIWIPAFPDGVELTYTGSPDGEPHPRDSIYSNVVNPRSLSAAAMIRIPGNHRDTNLVRNNSVEFFRNEAPSFCANSPMTYDLSARDPDGDSLDYYFTSPQGITYAGVYTSNQPMGKGVTIDSKTGVVSGRTPGIGNYIVAVAAREFRNGMYIGESVKEYVFNISDCITARAELPENIMSCSTYTVSFTNAVKNAFMRTYSWDFGVGSINSDTSNLENPTYTFPDSGLYRVRLVINEGKVCDDTAYTDVYVYPMLLPDFRLESDCIFPDSVVRFRDITSITNGTIAKWRWDFGVKTAGDQLDNDSSLDQHPTYKYLRSRIYPIKLVVTSDRGCVASVSKDIQVLSYDMLKVIPKDTAICFGDTLQLNASGTGSMLWTPAYRMQNPTSFTPIVFPDTSTLYNAALTLFPGCIINKTTFVDVKRFITVDAGVDTTVCLTDSITLSPISNALKYSWTPAATLNNPFAKNPRALPPGDMIYVVNANTGSCRASDSVWITTVAYPTIVATSDTSVCYGDRVQLFASGGHSYSWSPTTDLSNFNSPSPHVSPKKDITYTVAVTDIQGCPKPSFKEIKIRVVPPVKAFAGYDTSIIAGQPLQLTATGANHYLWTPETGLDNNSIANPMAIISNDVEYRVRASTAEGCYAYDNIKVRVFHTAPEIFVPNAFTPNNDGKNDVVRPTPVGIKEFQYFRVYNRWGQLIYQTAVPTKGWDGTLSGNKAGTGTYVWETAGIDYTGKKIVKRGTVTLIR